MLPVLIIGFNRPDLLHKAILNLKSLGVNKLFISLDGPRTEADIDNCKEVLEVASSFMKDFDLQIVHREYNLGCNLGVVAALDWFFSIVNFGIVLEDDCVINSNTIDYFQSFYNSYVHFENLGVKIASAHNPFTTLPDSSFTQYVLIYGWASSKDTWSLVRPNFFKVLLPPFFNKYTRSQPFHEKIFWWASSTRAKIGGIDTWDGIFTDCLMRMGVKTLVPAQNMIENVGFGPSATHTKDTSGSIFVSVKEDVINFEIDSLLRTHYFKIKKRHGFTPFLKVIADILRLHEKKNFENLLAMDKINQKKLV
jgi:hypothetical protein